MALTPTYRETTTRPARRRRPLLDVHLTGLPRHVQRAIASVRIVAALVAAVAFFLPWHVVHPLEGGLGEAFCWAPDCPRPPSPPPPPTYGSAYTHTGWEHSTSVLPLVVLAVLVGLSLVPFFRRPRMLAALGLAGGCLVAMVTLFFTHFDFQHLFDETQTLFGERLYDRAGAVITWSVAADLVTAPLLYLWARARLPRV